MPQSMIAEQLARLRRQRTAPVVLELDLTGGIAEEPSADPVSAVLTMRRSRLADLLEGLRRARNDQRVKALVVKLGGRPIGLATVQEIRRAVEEFRDAGKLTVGVGRDLRRVLGRQRAVLPGHRVRHDLPAAIG